MRSLRWASLAAVVLVLSLAPPAHAAPAPADLTSLNTRFVTRSDSRLDLDGKPFRFAGTNIYWLGLDENVGGVAYPTFFRIRDALDTAKAMGMTVVRSHMLASTGNPLSILPSKEAGFNDEAFATVDYAIAYAGSIGLRLILPLTDEWSYYHGGHRDFTEPYGLPSEAFYTDERVIADYQAYAEHVMRRVNPLTGKAYNADPTIMAWEFGNELEGMTLDWINTNAVKFRQWAPRQLIAAGRRFDLDPDTLAAPGCGHRGRALLPADGRAGRRRRGHGDRRGQGLHRRRVRLHRGHQGTAHPARRGPQRHRPAVVVAVRSPRPGRLRPARRRLHPALSRRRRAHAGLRRGAGRLRRAGLPAERPPRARRAALITQVDKRGGLNELRWRGAAGAAGYVVGALAAWPVERRPPGAAHRQPDAVDRPGSDGRGHLPGRPGRSGRPPRHRFGAGAGRPLAGRARRPAADDGPGRRPRERHHHPGRGRRRRRGLDVVEPPGLQRVRFDVAGRPRIKVQVSDDGSAWRTVRHETDTVRDETDTVRHESGDVRHGRGDGQVTAEIGGAGHVRVLWSGGKGLTRATLWSADPAPVTAPPAAPAPLTPAPGARDVLGTRRSPGARPRARASTRSPSPSTPT
ncbi:cellulase family glycosylhydrolase [Nonomuraea rubra]|uniref:cellulase family glycosylhydrolase n=1 Tax=Nonomuraea rubra TaxID=46180 RepID=UPI0031F09BD2